MFAFPSISKYFMVGLMPSREGVGEFLWQSNSTLSAWEGREERLKEKRIGER